ncbi:MAG: RNA polymerase subunit sigma-70 [Selenomonas sp.]|nr:RNA polymerase subunit sigma-70 [Selenomonas sp.]
MTDMEKREIAQLRGLGMGYGKISRQLDIPLSTVKSYCLRNNVVSGARKSVCMACGRPLGQGDARKGKKFCSDGCRIKWWSHHTYLMKANCVCVHCGRAFHGRTGRKYCSHQCYIEERFGGNDDSKNVKA